MYDDPKILNALMKIKDFGAREVVKEEFKRLQDLLTQKDQEIEDLKYQIKMFYA